MLISSTNLAVIKAKRTKNDDNLKNSLIFDKKKILFSKTFCHYCLIEKKNINYCYYCQKYLKSTNLIHLRLTQFEEETKHLFKKFEPHSGNPNISSQIYNKNKQIYYQKNFFLFFAHIFLLNLFNKRKQNQILPFVKFFLQLYYNFFKLLLIISTIAFILLNSNSFCAAAANKDAARLFEDLLTDYNKLVRPVDNNSDTLIVNFKLKLSQLLDVVNFFFF